MTMSADERKQAEKRAEQARKALSSSLDALDQRAHHIVHQVTEAPAVAKRVALPIGAAVVLGGAAVVGGLVVHGLHSWSARRRHERSLAGWLERKLTPKPAEPSFWSGLGRAVIYGAAGVLAQAAARRAIEARFPDDGVARP